MQAELRQKWVDALRSGKYQQGQQVLRTASNEYCCLGVLCDVIAPNDWLTASRRGYGGSGIDHKMASPQDLGMLDLDVRNRIGLKDAHRLSDMNDAGKSFAEIADYIEANIPVDSQVAA